VPATKETAATTAIATTEQTGFGLSACHHDRDRGDGQH
jgi:hypothetical protein